MSLLSPPALAAVALTLALAYVAAPSPSTSSAYKSVVTQSFNYFSRPHAGIARNPVRGPSAWRGAELRQNYGSWVTNLTREDVEAMRAAVAAAREALERSGRELGEMTRLDFPLSEGLEAKMRQWRKDVSAEGRGFTVIRGVPVDEWTDIERKIFFWGFGRHFGTPGAQDNDGDLLGHIKDTGADPKTSRQYKTNAHILPHCDSADVVGLLCLQSAREGGTSRLVSSVTIYNEMLQRHPESIERLYEPFPLDTRGSGGVSWVPIEPVRFGFDGILRTFYHMEYYRSVYGAHVPDSPDEAIPEKDRVVLDQYDALANDGELYLDMDFLPGDIQLLSNHLILHSRSGYQDDNERKRYLLRLWLSMSESASFGSWDWFSKRVHVAQLAGRFVVAKLRRWLAK